MKHLIMLGIVVVIGLTFWGTASQCADSTPASPVVELTVSQRFFRMAEELRKLMIEHPEKKDSTSVFIELMSKTPSECRGDPRFHMYQAIALYQKGDKVLGDYERDQFSQWAKLDGVSESKITAGLTSIKQFSDRLSLSAIVKDVTFDTRTFNTSHIVRLNSGTENTDRTAPER